MISDGINLAISKIKSFQLEFYNDTTMLNVIEGELALESTTRNITMKKNDIIIINPQDEYAIRVVHEGIVFTMRIECKIFEGIVDEDHLCFNCHIIGSNTDGKDYVFKQLLNRLLFNCLQNDFKPGFSQISECYQVLEYMVKHYLCPAAGSGATGISLNNQYAQKAVRYIQSRYNTKVSLMELAKQLYISDSHLCRILKKTLGMGFRDYVNKVRLQHAVEDLLNTDNTILRIANDNGFSGITIFNKVFKSAYSATPSGYRMAYQTKAKPQPLSRDKQAIIERTRSNVMNYLQEYCPNQSRLASVKPIEFTANAGNSRPYTKAWQSAINLGVARDLLNYKVQKHVIDMKEELDFQYIRFWGLFHDDMMVLPGTADENFNFSKIVDIINFLLANHMKPYFQLGPKSRIITKGPRSTTLLNDVNDRISTYSDQQWHKLIDTFMRELIFTYGGQEVDTWIFEMWLPCPWDSIWYEWYTEEKYAIVYRTVKQYVPNALVGIGELVMSAHQDKLAALIAFWKENGVVPDFLSLSGFPYDVDLNKDTSAKWITDPNYLNDLLDNIQMELEANRLAQIKLFLSTWNITISSRNVINDTVFKGAYIINNAIASIDRTDMLCYWTCSDLYSEHRDSKGILFGGSGLLSKDGIRKPAYYAFAFLSRLRSGLVDKGSNYIITSNRYGNITVIYHNIKELNHVVHMKRENEITYEDIQNSFFDTDPLSFVFGFNNMDSQLFNIRIQKVTEQEGSILDEWNRIGAYPDLPAEEKNYLSQISIPRQILSRKQAENGKLQISITAKPNEFGVIEITAVAI